MINIALSQALENTLENEYHALLSGSLAEIEKLGAEKLELLERIGALPERDIGEFTVFRDRLFRNQNLAQSAIKGMRKAIMRTKDVADVSMGLRTYGANGQKQHVPTKASGVLSKSFVKLTVYSLCLALFLWANADIVVGASAGTDRGAILVLFDLLISFLSLVVLIAASIAIIDYGWQVMEHQRKNRMSHKEMRDQSKDSEGDPHLKQARRMRAQEIAHSQMMSDVPTADVIIVNPTHYAVALKWEGSRTAAPICVAKGVDEIALRIRAVASDSKVAIHSDPPTARALFAVVEIGQEIKPEHYAAVAVAIRFAEALRQGKRREAF